MTMAFIVDGQLEKLAVQRLCPDAPIRVTNLNGRSVNISALAEKIGTLLKLYGDRYYPIVVLVDREDREASSEQIESDLLGELVKQGFDPEPLIIACPDRMIENWIVAGKSSYKEAVIEVPAGGSDDFNGKKHLKKYLAVIGVTYGETTIGVQLFCAIDAKCACESSPSFARFRRKIGPFCPKFREVL